MEFTLNQIAGMLGGKVRGDGNQKINMLAKIQDAKEGQIAFLANPKYEQTHSNNREKANNPGWWNICNR
jgi:UDP-3-O-[3-hydroxymyristoyl] glucosamine N-acyltransferase